MSHLTLEALARLVDEAPEAEEREHLAGCASCRAELEAVTEQTDALGGMPMMAPPPDLWPAISARLRREGLVAGARRGRGRWLGATLTRIAAALLLFLAGGTVGYAARGPAAATDAPVATAPAAAADRTAPDYALAPNNGAADLSLEVERAQEAFAWALDRYMMANSTEAPDPAARLAALDHIVMTTAEALNQSPADPVINSYHLTAVAQRNELLRQLAASGAPVF